MPQAVTNMLILGVLTQSIGLLLILAAVGIGIQTTLRPLYGSVAPTLYYTSIKTAIYVLATLWPFHRFPKFNEFNLLIALAGFCACSPYLTYALGKSLAKLTQDPIMGSSLTTIIAFLPFILSSVALFKRWNAQLLVPVLSGTLMTTAVITSTANTLQAFAESRMWRFLPLGSPLVGSQIFLALTGCLVVWAAGFSNRKPKSRGNSNHEFLGRFIILAIPIALGVIGSRLPPIASPVLPYVRHSVSSRTGRSASVRVLAQQESITGLILTGEYIEDDFRFLRADHSLLGGRWIGSKVAPDSRNGLGDSIYSTFVLQEAVRLIETRDRKEETGERERALFIGLGVGIAAESFLAHKIHTTIIEIDPVVYTHARKYFGLPEPNEVFLEDAQHWIDNQPTLSEDEKYDYIIHDCFSGGGVPGHIYTVEFWNKLKRVMKKDGVITVNFVGKLGSDSARAIYLTLETSYGECRGYHDNLHAELREEQAFLNILVFCSNTPWHFRDANVDDYLGSYLRKHMLGNMAQRELPRAKILGHIEGEYQWILHANESNRLVKWEESTALEHWRVMREVLPDIFWETY